jgi:hypothetical protein
MPFIPPDPGKVRAILDGLLVQLEQLEALATESGNHVLVAEAAALRASIDRIEEALST